MTSESGKLGLTSTKIDSDYAFTEYLAALNAKLDAIALGITVHSLQYLV